MGSFWWKAIPIFRGITSCKPGRGDSILLWKDSWSDGCLSQKFACLFSYNREEDISIEKYCDLGSIGTAFFTPISPEALAEMHELDDLVVKADITQWRADNWVPIWGSFFSASKFYNYCFRNIIPPTPFKWIWKSNLSPKIKIFMWLLLSSTPEICYPGDITTLIQVWPVSFAVLIVRKLRSIFSCIAHLVQGIGNTSISAGLHTLPVLKHSLELDSDSIIFYSLKCSLLRPGISGRLEIS